MSDRDDFLPDNFEPIELDVDELAPKLNIEQLTKLAFHNDITDQAHRQLLAHASKRITNQQQLIEWLLDVADGVMRQHSEGLLTRHAMPASELPVSAIGDAALSLMSASSLAFCGPQGGGFMPLVAIMDSPMLSELAEELGAEGEGEVTMLGLKLAWDAARDEGGADGLGMMTFAVGAADHNEEQANVIAKLRRLPEEGEEFSAEALNAAGQLALGGGLLLDVYVADLNQPGDRPVDNRLLRRHMSAVRYSREAGRFQVATLPEEYSTDLSPIKPVLLTIYGSDYEYEPPIEGIKA